MNLDSIACIRCKEREPNSIDPRYCKQCKDELDDTTESVPMEIYGKPGIGTVKTVDSNAWDVLLGIGTSNSDMYQDVFKNKMQFTPCLIRHEVFPQVVRYLGHHSSWFVDATMSNKEWVGLWLSKSSAGRMQTFQVKTP